MQSIIVNGKNVVPSKVVCIGRNYVEHIEELNNEVPTEPVIFVKPNSAIHNEIATDSVDEIHYEAEISLIVDNNKFIAAGIGLDLTKREVQGILKAKGLPWERAKAFDKSAVFSAFVTFECALESLCLKLFINGELIQQANVCHMIYHPDQIVKNVSKFMSFENNDILMTGTPKGVGKINQGDQFIGQLYANDKLLVSESWTVL